MLANTAYVILGLLQKGPLSGYDIKSKVDLSARHFYSASYGQIYPELKRLERAGLIKGTERRNGRRARTEYELTTAGRAALLEWLREPSAGVEIRDEGMLKFFFGGALRREDLLARVAAMRAARAAELDELREIADDIPEDADELQRAVLEHGIGLYEYVVAWCDRIAAEFERRDASEFPIERAGASPPRSRDSIAAGVVGGSSP